VIKVDESGTVASAATAVVFNNISGLLPDGQCPPVVDLNHPFVYVIEHEPTGEVIFAGQLGDPSVQ
jgi:serine protease inhibitor